MLICGDALTVMNKMRPMSVDLAITSPPYDSLRDYNGYVFNFEGIATTLYTLIKIGGILVWVVNDSTINGDETGTSFNQALFFKTVGFRLHDTMIYAKTGCAMPAPNRYLSNFEYMFVFSKGKPKTFNPIEDRKNRFPTRWGKGRKVRKKDGSWSYRENYVGKEYGRRFNIWRYSNGGQGYGHPDNPELASKHPATFPLQLATDHIISWSNPGELVLDPMCGSGTTGVAALQLRRNFIGIDISQEYVELSTRRIAEAQEKLNARP